MMSESTRKKVTILFHRVLGDFGRGIFVHPLIHNYYVALRDYYDVEIIATGDGKKTTQIPSGLVRIFRRMRGLRDGFSLQMISRMVRDNPDLVIIIGYRHLVTLFALIIYGVKKTPLLVVNTGLYDLKSQRTPILLLRNFLINKLLIRSGATLANLSVTDQLTLSRYLGLPNKRNLFLNIWNTDDKAPFRVNLPCLNKLPRRGVVALYVGRLDGGKEVKTLLCAVKRVNEAGGNCYLIIVGDGPHKNRLKFVADTLGLKDSVCFTGWIPHDSLWQYYGVCNFVVLPTKTEGRPLVVIEALANGRPVLASDLPQIREVIQDGYNGLLFRTENDLAGLIIELMQNKPLLNVLTINAKQSSSTFDPLENSRRFLKLVRSLTQ
jgi:glycosyltransferase involved in cell wall biosynthesis